jgi:hypothetical protein
MIRCVGAPCSSQRRVGGVEVETTLVEDMLEEVQLLEVSLEDTEGGVILATSYALHKNE